MVDSVSWEVPGGAVDQGETLEQAVVRECLEETGVRCFNPQPLLFYHVGLDTFYNPTYLFYTKEIAPKLGPQSINSREVSGCEWVPLGQCIEMVFRQQIVDSFSIVALLSYQNLIHVR
jgi:8-oxo-dGTP pyrophosphatase MutT (NUDIX family)